MSAALVPEPLANCWIPTAPSFVPASSTRPPRALCDVVAIVMQRRAIKSLRLLVVLVTNSNDHINLLVTHESQIC